MYFRKCYVINYPRVHLELPKYTTNLVTYSITEEVTALRLRRGGQEARRRQASREGAGGHQQCALVRRAPGPGGWQVWSSRRDVGAHEVELDPF